MGMSSGGGGRAVPYINVTPLIDVLLVLLIIFMVVTPLKPSRFKADIPTQKDPNEDLSRLKPNPLTLVVSISTDLQLKLNQDSIGSVNDTGPLASKLQQTFEKRRTERAFKQGMETRVDLPESERIEKTVRNSQHTVRTGVAALEDRPRRRCGRKARLLLPCRAV